MERVTTYSSLPPRPNNVKMTDINLLTGGARPSGTVLVHNHVVPPAKRSGTRGFRFWLQPPDAGVVVCDCGWRPELGRHFSILLRRGTQMVRAADNPR
jgi:hypothetical protein